ncbi:MAG: nuclear transport factor 2 family protein [Sterolibacterium sp.]
MKFILTMLLCMVSLAVLAGPLDQKKAESHLKAVAAGDIEGLMADYADDAYMEWVGGPLDGRYTGKAAIREVWTKFVAANDKQPRPANVGKLATYSNPKGVSLHAEAEYGGKTPVKVWHVFVYRDGVLTSETWQIAPAIKVSD